MDFDKQVAFIQAMSRESVQYVALDDLAPSEAITIAVCDSTLNMPALELIETEDSPKLTVAKIAQTIATNFRDELGISGGRIYEARGDDTFEIVGRFGEANDAALGIVVPRDYKPIELVLENGIVVMD